MTMTGAQRGRIYDIKDDLFCLADMNKIDITDATMDFIQTYLQKVLDEDDGMTAFQLIGLWHEKSAVEFINFIMKKHQVIV